MSSIYYQTSEESFDNFFESSTNEIESLFDNLPLDEQSTNLNLKLENIESETRRKPKAAKGKKFICYLETCRKEFTQFCSLQKHERIHRGEKPFVCEVCGHAFTQLSNLKRHERLHTGEKPYSCEHCSKAFSNISNLKQHLQIHDDTKNRSKYSCKLCSRSYYYQSSLRKHMKEEHKGNLDAALSTEVSEPEFNESVVDDEIFAESQLRKMVKIEIGSDEKKRTLEIALQVNEEEMNELPQNFRDILSNSSLMREMQQAAVDSAAQGSNPVESFEKIRQGLSSFFDMNLFFSNGSDDMFAEESFFPVEKQVSNTHSSYADASTPENFSFEDHFLKIENECSGLWEKKEYFEQMFPADSLFRNEAF